MNDEVKQETPAVGEEKTLEITDAEMEVLTAPDVVVPGAPEASENLTNFPTDDDGLPVFAATDSELDGLKSGKDKLIEAFENVVKAFEQVVPVVESASFHTGRGLAEVEALKAAIEKAKEIIAE
jgi:hypothetical protein